MTVFVIGMNGERLMPTERNGKVRHLLKDGQAEIVCRNPFTIRLLYETTTCTQPIELCVDTGHQHIGISLKSDSKEYVSAQFDLPYDEKERTDARRAARRNRRNRKRYRACRYNNRKKDEGWLAPSVRHKVGRHVDIVERLCAVAPVSSIILEIGQFDPQLLDAIQNGKSIPEGKDYQHGDRYGIATLREAVFQRDAHKCVFCGRSGIFDNAILHTHHAYYWRRRHGNRLDELATCCEKCHTSANHQKGGKLWGFDKKMPDFRGVAFMNSVRYKIGSAIQSLDLGAEVKVTYGADTKLSRTELGLEKSHVNDAYAMGQYHPEKRADFLHLVKKRRNNRILEKFYDAKLIDTRDGRKKSGKELGCERVKRYESRGSDKSLRKYRGPKVSAGRRSIRKQRYPIQPGDTIIWEGNKYISKGCHCNGKRVMLTTGKSVSVKDIHPYKMVSGWKIANF